MADESTCIDNDCTLLMFIDLQLFLISGHG